MDTDATMSRISYEEKFGKFAKGEYDIMVGTQMVAKGGARFSDVNAGRGLLADMGCAVRRGF